MIIKSNIQDMEDFRLCVEGERNASKWFHESTCHKQNNPDLNQYLLCSGLSKFDWVSEKIK